GFPLFAKGRVLIPDPVPGVGPLIGKHSFAKLTLGFNINLLHIGAGALIGLRTTAWMAVGATICWAGLIPWAVDHGFAQPAAQDDNYFAKGAKWCMWPGVTMMVVAGLLSFALKAKSIARALSSLRTLPTAVAAGPSSHEDVEVPMRWAFWGLGVASIMTIVA